MDIRTLNDDDYVVVDLLDKPMTAYATDLVDIDRALRPYRAHPDEYVSTHNRAVAIAVQAMEAEGVDPRTVYEVAYRMLNDDRFTAR